MKEKRDPKPTSPGEVSSALRGSESNWFRQATYSGGLWAGAVLGELLGSQGRDEFGVLMYHRVANETPSLSFPTWNVRPKTFRNQIEGLLRRGFQPLSLSRVFELREKREKLPAKCFVVTFDDVFECVYSNAFPILRELNVPATLFLATAYLDSSDPLPFDDWDAKGDARAPQDHWRAIRVEQCHVMQSSGLIEFGAHSHTHVDFRGRMEELRSDLRTCLQRLHELFGAGPRSFAFPYGTRETGFAGPPLSPVVREEGLLCAFSTEWERAALQGDPFEWGRFLVEEIDTSATLAGKLTGWYSRVRSAARTWSKTSAPWSPKGRNPRK